MIGSTLNAASQPPKIKFYHRTARLVFWLVLVTSGVLSTAPASAAAPSDNLDKPPPRSIDDLAKLLEHYKPDPAAAAKAQAAADMPMPASGDRQALFTFYADRAQAAANIGRVNQQVQDFRKATENGSGNTKEEVQVLRDLATAEVIGGNLLRSIQAAEEAVQRTDGKNLGQALAAYQQLTQLYILVGDFDKARGALRQTESTYSALGSSKNWSYFHDNWNANLERARGELFRAEGRMVEAEAAYRKGLRSLDAFHAALRGGMTPPNFTVYDRQRSERYREVLLRNIAQSLMGQGKYIDAEISLRRSLRYSLERVGRNAPDTGTTLMQLSNCLSEQGRFADAVRLAEEAVSSFEQAGATPESLFMANSRRALASTYVAQARYPEAVTTFERMQRGLDGDPVLAQRLATGDLDWVLALLRTGKASAAENMASTLLKREQQRNASGTRLAEVRAFHAMALAATGQYETALTAFQQSLPKLIDNRRNDEEAGTGSVKRQQRLIAAIESYLNLLFETSRDKPAARAQAAAESFMLADIARGSSVQQALTASAARASISDPALADLARREQDAQRRIAALSEILTQLLAAPPAQQLPQVQAKMREDLDAIKAERAKLKKEIEQRFPEYAELVSPRPATLTQAQKLLKPGEAIVTWYFGEQGGWSWAINKQGDVGFSSVPYNRQQIRQAVQDLRKSLDPGVASIDDIPAFDVVAAHRLYTGLLAPLTPQWKGAQTLLAIPHADLGQLPLALLPSAAVAQPAKSAVPFTSYRDVPWLARQIAITQLPSVTALASLRRLPAPQGDRRSFIGFGDPLFNTDQAKQADKTAQADTGLSTRGSGRMQLRSVPQTSSVSTAELGILPRLPDTSQEIREIAGVLQADPQQDIYLQKRATVRTVLNSNLANRRVIMFATHGLVPGELDGLVQPALALTSPEVADPDSDGLLTMDKILTLKLNADWVVLSACNTAAGEGAGTEAVSGLGRAFFYAGTRALLVSNWPVETVAARKLMTDLFRRQVNTSGMVKAEALRQSMLSLIDGPGNVDEKSGRVSFSYAHPLFWAPFVVVGD